MIAQAGDLGIAGYVSQNYAAGSIGFVNYSYALNTHFPVVKMLNAAGYYTEPTPQNVAVSLLKDQINTTSTDPSVYLTQNLDNVFTDPDPRTYPLSSYGYLILPTTVQGQFTAAKGKTLAAFATYAMCQGQQESASLGYSPMPVNLVEAALHADREDPRRGPHEHQHPELPQPDLLPQRRRTCSPRPHRCRRPATREGSTQCATGTGGARAPTLVTVTASGGSGSGSNGSGSGSNIGATQGSNAATGSDTGSGAASAGTGTSIGREQLGHGKCERRRAEAPVARRRTRPRAIPRVARAAAEQRHRRATARSRRPARRSARRRSCSPPRTVGARRKP